MKTNFTVNPDGKFSSIKEIVHQFLENTTSKLFPVDIACENQRVVKLTKYVEKF